VLKANEKQYVLRLDLSADKVEADRN